jgi:hypothetical protein
VLQHDRHVLLAFLKSKRDEFLRVMGGPNQVSEFTSNPPSADALCIPLLKQGAFRARLR